MPAAAAEAGWGYSAGIQQVSLGYSGVSEGSVSPELCPSSNYENNPHTWVTPEQTHAHKRLEDLPDFFI